MKGELIRGLEASQGGTKQHKQHEEQQEGPQGLMTHLDPTTLGRLWLRDAPQMWPKGLPGGRQWSAKGRENHCVSIIRGLAASQGGTQQQNRQDEEHEGP